MEEDAVHPMHPALADPVNRAHIADLRRRPVVPLRGTARHRRPRAVRQATGWFLVHLGLRLALPVRPDRKPLSPVAR
jgi:hypothetical protein